LHTVKYFVDANIFLEVELGQQKADICEEALRRFQRGELEGLVSDFTMDTVVIVMENYERKWDEIRGFLSGFLGYRGLRICFSGLPDRIRATDHMRDFGLDFDDALTLQTMMENGAAEIVSYDRDFDSVPSIRRTTPEDLLQESASSSRGQP